jgi:hypothetical protein
MESKRAHLYTADAIDVEEAKYIQRAPASLESVPGDAFALGWGHTENHWGEGSCRDKDPWREGSSWSFRRAVLQKIREKILGVKASVLVQFKQSPQIGWR